MEHRRLIKPRRKHFQLLLQIAVGEGVRGAVGRKAQWVVGRRPALLRGKAEVLVSEG